MPYTNTQTGKIVGCKKGSWAYYHEEGHNIYANSEKGISNGVKEMLWLRASIILTLVTIVFRWMFVPACISVTLSIGYYFYEELWCNLYAYRKLRRKK